MTDKQFQIYTDTQNWIVGLPGWILDLVESYDFANLGKKTIVCTITLVSGFEITGYSSPVKLEDFNEDLGTILAKRKVLEELISLERYKAFTK